MARHLLVTNDFPPKTGGIQTYLYELWRRLEPGRAAVLSAFSHPHVLDFDRQAAMAVSRVPARTLYLPGPRTRRAVMGAVARHDPHLVLFDPVWPLGLLGPSLDRPYGVVVHGAELAIPARLPGVRASLERVLRGAAVAVCAGPYPAAEVRRLAPDAAVVCLEVPPGVDPERFRPATAGERAATRQRLGFDVGAPLVVSHSRLVPRKGMDTLIRAAAHVPALRGGVIAIAGSGRDRQRLERLAARHAAPVRFLGRVDDASLPALLAAADVMVMDCRSRWGGLEQEGFGIVFLEAAACGVPQVAGRSGGSHDAVADGETGIVVDDPTSPTQLAGAIEALLADGARRAAMGAAARERAVREFSWDTLAQRLGAGLAPFDEAASLKGA